uniref:Uncharacterized protein n=1 Tax=Oryzias latipes TaxID=8090 RepID=A0A3B3I874_ORYLA
MGVTGLVRKHNGKIKQRRLKSARLSAIRAPQCGARVRIQKPLHSADASALRSCPARSLALLTGRSLVPCGRTCSGPLNATCSFNFPDVFLPLKPEH